MNAWIERVSLSGPVLRIAVREPLPADVTTLAVASALRVFERFPVLDGLVLAAPGGELRLSRGDVERWLAPDNLGAVHERARWPQLLARAVQRYAGAAAGEPA